MRLLGLDVGEKRVGVAFSESGVFASPHSIVRRKSKQEDFDRIAHLVSQLAVDLVVVGMPYSLSDGPEMGPQALRIKRYGDALAEVISVPVTYFDERYSTADAVAHLSAGSRKRKQQHVDDAAAAVILQNYLDAQAQE